MPRKMPAQKPGKSETLMIWWLGFREAFVTTDGRTWGHPETPQSRAYDSGKTWAERVFRLNL